MVAHLNVHANVILFYFDARPTRHEFDFIRISVYIHTCTRYIVSIYTASDMVRTHGYNWISNIVSTYTRIGCTRNAAAVKKKQKKKQHKNKEYARIGENKKLVLNSRRPETTVDINGKCPLRKPQGFIMEKLRYRISDRYII